LPEDEDDEVTAYVHDEYGRGDEDEDETDDSSTSLRPMCLIIVLNMKALPYRFYAETATMPSKLKLQQM
jgi:hypothetical protein